MPTVEFSIRLDGKSEGSVKVFMKDEQSLKEARGNLLQHLLLHRLGVLLSCKTLSCFLQDALLLKRQSSYVRKFFSGIS